MDESQVFAFPTDPYLEWQPAPASTLPIQLLVSGITLTLLVVLLIHLLFTTQYHYPLAPLNYGLQLSSIIAVLIGVCIRIQVILKHSLDNASTWPYDLDYIAVPIPGLDWSQGEDAAWFLLLAISNGLANITHIQFLTLLYPSRTEARLILVALGPLAIASSALYFCTLSTNKMVIDIGDAIRNVLSSCLLLIFSLSLCLWGFVVNRKRAWRLDGGTGVFGAGALGLTFVTTASTFVSIKEERIDWLQHLIWAAVLWQTWLGWWWWVGAGMGIGEVEDIMERTIRRHRKAARRLSYKDKRRNTATQMVKTASNNVVGFTSGIASHLLSSNGSRDGSTPSRRTVFGTRRPEPERPASVRERDPDVEEGIQDDSGHEDIERGNLRLREPDVNRARGGTDPGSATNGAAFSSSENGGAAISSNSETSSTSRTPSLHAPRTMGEAMAFPLSWFQVFIHRLRRDHMQATQRSAVEQAERRSRVPQMTGNAQTHDDSGWGLGAYGVREAEQSTRRIHQANEQIRAGRLLGQTYGSGSGSGSGDEDDEYKPSDDLPGIEVEAASSRQGSTRSARRRVGDGVRPSAESSRLRRRRRSSSSDWEDMDENATDIAMNELQTQVDGERPQGERDGADAHAQAQPHTQDRPRNQGSSWSWWGPMKEWRLNDRSTF